MSKLCVVPPESSDFFSSFVKLSLEENKTEALPNEIVWDILESDEAFEKESYENELDSLLNLFRPRPRSKVIQEVSLLRSFFRMRVIELKKDNEAVSFYFRSKDRTGDAVIGEHDAESILEFLDHLDQCLHDRELKHLLSLHVDTFLQAEALKLIRRGESIYKLQEKISRLKQKQIKCREELSSLRRDLSELGTCAIHLRQNLELEMSYILKNDSVSITG